MIDRKKEIVQIQELMKLTLITTYNRNTITTLLFNF